MIRNGARWRDRGSGSMATSSTTSARHGQGRPQVPAPRGSYIGETLAKWEPFGMRGLHRARHDRNEGLPCIMKARERSEAIE